MGEAFLADGAHLRNGLPREVAANTTFYQLLVSLDVLDLKNEKEIGAERGRGSTRRGATTVRLALPPRSWIFPESSVFRQGNT